MPMPHEEARAAMVRERGEQHLKDEINDKARTAILLFHKAVDALNDGGKMRLAHKTLAESDWSFTMKREGIEQTITCEQWGKMDSAQRHALFAGHIERVMVARRALQEE